MAKKVPWAIQYAFWWYSGFLDDILNEKRLEEIVVKNKQKELAESLTEVEKLTQSLRIWLEKKLLKLELLLREKKFRKREDFNDFVQSDEITGIAEELEGINPVYISEEEKRGRGKMWGQGIIDYMNTHP